MDKWSVDCWTAGSVALVGTETGGIGTALMPGFYDAAVGSPDSPPLVIAVTCGAAWVPNIRHAVDSILVAVDYMLGNRRLQLLAPAG